MSETHEGRPGRTTEERLTILEDRFDREVEAGGEFLARIECRLNAIDERATSLHRWLIPQGVVLLLAIIGGVIWTSRSIATTAADVAALERAVYRGGS